MIAIEAEPYDVEEEDPESEEKYLLDALGPYSEEIKPLSPEQQKDFEHWRKERHRIFKEIMERRRELNPKQVTKKPSD